MPNTNLFITLILFLIHGHLHVNNMALLINDAHIPLYHRDVVTSILLEGSYFLSPNYLPVKAWVRVTFLFPDIIELTGLFTYMHENVFLGVCGNL